jgi:hypothetical protein
MAPCAETGSKLKTLLKSEWLFVVRKWLFVIYGFMYDAGTALCPGASP